MCLIIFAPKGSSIQREWMLNAFTNNPDGAGFAYSDGTKTYTVKGLMTFAAFEEALNLVPRQYPRLIHFRYATLGVVNEENTHPFPLDKSGGVMAHNGPCVSQSFKGDATRSDSRHLAEDLMAKLDEGTIKLLHPVFEDFIESGNKLAFLFSDGSHMLVNEQLGTWKKGVWLSNTYSIECRAARWSGKYDDAGFAGGYGGYNYKSWTNVGELEPPIALRHWGNDGGLTETDSLFYYDDVNDEWYSYMYRMSLDDFLAAWWDGLVAVDTVAFSHDYTGTNANFGMLAEAYDITLTTPQEDAVVSPPPTALKPRITWGTRADGTSYAPTKTEAEVAKPAASMFANRWRKKA